MKERIMKAVVFGVLVVIFWNILDFLYAMIISRDAFSFTVYNSIIAPFVIGMIVQLLTERSG